MNESIYSARFISGPEEWERQCPVFRRGLKITKECVKATMCASSLGVYTAYINGQRVGKQVLTPGWTDYKTRLQYQTEDVTSLISCGDNEIIISVGHGWYASRIGTPNNTKGIYSQIPYAIAALTVEYADGSKETVYTDESWSVARSAVLMSQIYDGETYDARKTEFEWMPAIVSEKPTSILIPQEGEDILELCRTSAVKLIYTPAGETVIDFGQEVTGYVEFTVKGSSGQTVKIEHAEILDKDGNFYNENYRSALSMVTYILRDGTQTYKAHHTFYGFRYIRLTDWPEEIKLEHFTAISVYSDMKRTGWFECGVPKVNKLFSNIIWGQVDNFLDIPTDCPQRDERLGWTGDAEVFCRTATLNFDTRKFFKKWLRDLWSEQEAFNGAIPHIVPNLWSHQFSSAAWGDAATVCPWEIYIAFNDKEVLSDQFDSMKAWVEYIRGMGDEYLWNAGSHFGDWLGIDAPEGSYKGSTDQYLIATAYYYLSCGLLVKAGKVLGKDVSEYEKLAVNIKKAFNSTYVAGEGRLTSDTQTAYVVALDFGLVDNKALFAKRLVELIEERGDALSTGFVGTPYLLRVLSDNGYSEKAYTLLLREEFPSWLFSVNMGATTIWEHWDGLREDGSVWSKDMNSFNHYAYGSVAAWMYGNAAGIKIDEAKPGYEHFFITPEPDERLGYVKARYESRYGSIRSEWRYEGDKIRYCFEIPKGTTADVTVGGVTRVLGEGIWYI
ncbi:MAG: family 78 glycoside hydrolase catalytic domain [Clostridia bacterium]|nr:family 78 glycoside hydrolase catalytic domain [Clostridia bacterium]